MVTLHVSVWVEMCGVRYCKSGYFVTLHVSVWVEILVKLYFLRKAVVTLHVSVWVEMILVSLKINNHKASRSTWACELKWKGETTFILITESRSTWACELKSTNKRTYLTSWNVTLHVSLWVEMICLILVSLKINKSRSTWACELKLLWDWLSFTSTCHAPRERVSWNTKRHQRMTKRITSRSTWACELKSVLYRLPDLYKPVTLHVSVWVEIINWNKQQQKNSSRSTWACELKFYNSSWNL